MELNRLLLDVIHQLNKHHRDLLEQTGKAGCYYCKENFTFEEIVEWTDNSLTAVCPKCHIDAVVPNFHISINYSGHVRTTSLEVLTALHNIWFKE